MSSWDAIVQQISETEKKPFVLNKIHHQSGGCINQAYLFEGDHHSYFVKLNDVDLLSMFEAEKKGLEEIIKTKSIRAPVPLCTGTDGTKSWIVMEFLKLGSRPRAEIMGLQLANMHKSENDQFGWFDDNTIGSTPQVNQFTDSWIEFWKDNRLGYQLNLAEKNGFSSDLEERGQTLLEQFPAFIDHNPKPCLLHGDLWGGNMSYRPDGQPVIYDPAVYYGDREADLAMTGLFSNPGTQFYASYHDHYPIDSGYTSRKTLYNLYHILNHVNLFGQSYLNQAVGMIDKLLAELGH